MSLPPRADGRGDVRPAGSVPAHPAPSSSAPDSSAPSSPAPAGPVPTGAGAPAAPGGAPQPSFLERTVLDQQVAESRRQGTPWPARLLWAPLALLVGLIVVTNLLARVLFPHANPGSATAAALGAAAELVLLLGCVALVRPVAAAEGGWGRALGVRRLQGADWLAWITGVGMVFVARIAVGIIANALTEGRALRQSSNVHLDHVTAGSVVLLVLLTVVLAPIAEEFVFRGILLRALLHRMPFWPAALISTAVFAGLHAYEVRTLAGALTLVGVIGVLGMTNAYLVRITGRLTPAIMVHATFNLLATVVVIAQH